MSQSSAYADALQRARQIAAKINPSGVVTESVGTKRHLEDITEPESKKMAQMGDPFGAQLAAMRSPSTNNSGHLTSNSSHSSMGAIITEETKVPDKMVGLIIGRGGEQISRLQAESGAKIQMAPDSNGLPERNCTLQGSREAISRAKEMINQIIQQRGPNDHLQTNSAVGCSGGFTTVEMMIPGPKVGLVIGKGGEMIRQLQEKAGVKMILMIPKPGMESHYDQNPDSEKPLRITGDPQKCEYAKQLVYDLIAERDMQEMSQYGSLNRVRARGYSEYGTGPSSAEVLVPQPAVGVVIGKGGDMIKKIQADSGARVQFQNAKSDIPGDKVCMLMGKPDQIQEAKRLIIELIDSVMRDSQMGRGRGGPIARGYPGPPPGRGRGGWGPPPPPPPPGGWENGDYGSGPVPVPVPRPGEKQESTFTIPASKCGLVIGKGGETIRQINQHTGAFCELDRRPSLNPEEKVFLIKGSPEQIDAARRMIAEKVGLPPPPGPPPPTKYPPGPGPQGPPPGYPPQGWGNGYPPWQSQGTPEAAPPSGDPNTAWANYYAHYYGQPQAPPAAPVQPPVPATPSTGQHDYSAQWVEYYRSLGMHEQADMVEQSAKASRQATQQSSQSQSSASASAETKEPLKDYSAQWAEYYRSQGMYKEAEMIEQAKAQKSSSINPPSTAQNPPAPGSQPAPVPPSQPVPAPPQPYPQPSYSQYGQYPQYYGTPQQSGYGYQGYPNYPSYPPRQE